MLRDAKMQTIHDRMFGNLLLTRTMDLEWNEFNGFLRINRIKMKVNDWYGK